MQPRILYKFTILSDLFLDNLYKYALNRGSTFYFIKLLSQSFNSDFQSLERNSFSRAITFFMAS